MLLAKLAQLVIPEQQGLPVLLVKLVTPALLGLPDWRVEVLVLLDLQATARVLLLSPVPYLLEPNLFW